MTAAAQAVREPHIRPVGGGCWSACSRTPPNSKCSAAHPETGGPCGATSLRLREAQVEAAIIVADAERAVVADTPRVGSGNKQTYSGVSSNAEEVELSRLRQAHEGLDDDAYESLVQESCETQTPRRRDALVDRCEAAHQKKIFR